MKSELAFFSRLSIVSVVAGLCLGCGGSSNSGSGSPPVTPSGPAAGSEFLYGLSGAAFGSGEIYVSSVDPSTGNLGAPSPASAEYTQVTPANYDGVSLMTTPSAKFVYMPGSNSNGYGIFGFSLAGTEGELTPLVSSDPYVPTQPFSNIQGVAIDGLGRYIYVSDRAGTTNTIRAFAIDPSTGELTDGPVLTASNSSTLQDGASDPAGKYLYWINQPNNAPNNASPYGLSVFSIDSGTGALTEIAGSPYPITLAGYTVNPFDITVSASGEYVYLPTNIFSSSNSNPGTTVIYAFLVSPTSGALTPIPSSPTSIGQASTSQISLAPNGNFLYTAENFGSPLTDGIGVFAINSSSGLVSGTASSFTLDNALGPIQVDPSGSVLVSLGDNVISSYAINASTGSLTPAQGIQGLPALGYFSILVVKIP